MKKKIKPGKEVINHAKREKTINLKPLTSEGVAADKKPLQKIIISAPQAEVKISS